jgi:D-erythrulose 4-kinase
MTRLFNDPSDFAEEMIEGFVAAHRNWVRRAPGGVVRSTRSTAGTPALVIGGGSGHSPAFAGLVGQGLAHGAAMGNLFASPSAQQVYNIAKRANQGAGVLLGYGNYAGDVLHFSQAQDRLRREGIDCRSLAVTDDVSSAPLAELHKRRGIAGDLTVFKIAGAAAEAGYSMDELEAVAQRANFRTRSVGVAFTGCTLPGADHALFEVPAGRMAVGMGIHGEPGIAESDVPSADGLAELFVAKLLAEVPEDIGTPAGRRVAVLLNGLGGVKYEELFVLYRRVAQLLAGAGLEIVEPEVGELVTSFDMAGASLTLCWLDDELEALWAAPADTPTFRKGNAAAAERLDDGEGWGANADGVLPAEEPVPVGSASSKDAATLVLAALEAAMSAVDSNAEELGRIDAVAGDGDHGIGMERGVHAAVEAARSAAAQGAGAATTLERGADAWADRAGGTSGALWGVALRSVAQHLGDEARPGARNVAHGVRDAAAGIMAFGKASVGDKTMIDVLVPFAEALGTAVESGRALLPALGEAAEVAEQAAKDTAALVPRMGRARPLAEKSLGTPDAGAVSLSLIIRAIEEAFSKEES